MTTLRNTKRGRGRCLWATRGRCCSGRRRGSEVNCLAPLAGLVGPGELSRRDAAAKLPVLGNVAISVPNKPGVEGPGPFAADGWRGTRTPGRFGAKSSGWCIWPAGQRHSCETNDSELVARS